MASQQISIFSIVPDHYHQNCHQQWQALWCYHQIYANINLIRKYQVQMLTLMRFVNNVTQPCYIKLKRLKFNLYNGEPNFFTFNIGCHTIIIRNVARNENLVIYSSKQNQIWILYGNINSKFWHKQTHTHTLLSSELVAAW